eukprot:TRINITY_DN1547_c0_g1_i2.p1 TRINITY_DN1547_c0_g1~~TRINITY_DN1547_c0_g1_i2.p1  ORF type:complete len:371 (+),score=-28.58 TRINITY_DN1547_c0_g1_i2:89-1114(+)
MVSPYNLAACGKGHELGCVNSETGQLPSKYTCITCSSERLTSGEGWLCLECIYWICPCCRPLSYNSVLPRSVYSLCKCKTKLAWCDTNSYHSVMEDFICRVCHQTNKVADGLFMCPHCKYEVCKFCRPLIHYTTCHNGHKLTFTNIDNQVEEHKDGRYCCKNCHRYALINDGYWLCAECNYELCQECRPLPNPPVDLEKFKVCGCNIPVHWQALTHAFEGTVYNCRICNESQKFLIGCWACTHCGYYVCPVCRPKESLAKLSRCSHCEKRLKWGGSVPVLIPYRCDECDKLYQTIFKRWTCPDCVYNMRYKKVLQSFHLDKRQRSYNLIIPIYVPNADHSD